MQLDDETFLARFLDRELAAEHFDHRAHLRLAWLYLQRYPLLEACARMCADTRDFAAALGAAEKYHHTITEALMRISYQRMCDRRQAFDTFLAANSDLLNDARGLLARHYSDECLHSIVARGAWVEPDLAPIDDCLPC
jgi:hypothetical protein